MFYIYLSHTLALPVDVLAPPVIHSW